MRRRRRCASAACRRSKPPRCARSETVLEAIRTARGVLRSLRIYYGGRDDRAAMDRLYTRFVKPGDLVFDVGAHVGDRIAAFRRLGARVVACEPNPPLVKKIGRASCRE